MPLGFLAEYDRFSEPEGASCIRVSRFSCPVQLRIKALGGGDWLEHWIGARQWLFCLFAGLLDNARKRADEAGMLALCYAGQMRTMRCRDASGMLEPQTGIAQTMQCCPVQRCGAARRW